MTDYIAEVYENTSIAEIYEDVIDVVVEIDGMQGAAGPRGPGLISGEGPPDAGDGDPGDTWLDVLTGSIYGPKGASVWPSVPISTITGVQTQAYTVPGALYAGIGRARFRPNRTITVVSTAMSVAVAGTGTGQIVADLLRDGVSVYPSPAARPSIAAGEFDSAVVTLTGVTVTAAEALTLSIVEVCTVQPGAELTFLIHYY